LTQEEHKLRRVLRGIALRLALAQIIAWAGTLYIFPALLPTWEAAFDWSKAQISGAFTVALLLSACAAPIAGRLIDKGFGRSVFLGSYLLASGGLFALSAVQSLWQFYAVWALLGVTMAGTLYEACFAVITRYFGVYAQRAITIVTLIAGFAGSVSFPTAQLITRYSNWRVAVAFFAVAMLCIALPLAWQASSRAMRHSSGVRKAATRHAEQNIRQTLASPLFWLLGFAFLCIALEHGLLLTHLLPLLYEYGLSADGAIVAAAMIGPMQVVGRILMITVESRLDAARIAAISFAFMALAALALLGVSAVPALIVVFVLLHGSGYGVTSVTRPVVTAEFLGRENFGAISGMLATLFMAAFAVAPTVAAFVWELGGYDLVVVSALAIALCGMLLFSIAMQLHRRRFR
jgi:MFS family permease